jgi:hypothetical protein
MSEKLEVASASIRDINRTLETMAAGGTHSEASRMEALKTKIPKQYHCFLNLFSEAVTEELPPHRAYDHHIPLNDGFTPLFGKFYAMSHLELEDLKEFLEANLSK